MVCVEDLLREQNCIRVFGYGSLIWKPDFEYDNKYLGHIEGYERRFWQGSVHHRGTEEKPGRVLTLTKTEKGRCCGVVFEVTGEEKIKAALEYLNTRECRIGGYEAVIVPVYVPNPDGTTSSMPAILYYATPKNDLFVNDCCVETLAEDIARARGICGYNCEYLMRTTDFMRDNLPDVEEDHLYTLDKLVRIRLGLGPNNTLPWSSLVTMTSFHILLDNVQSNEREHLMPSVHNRPYQTIIAA